jgi:DNA-binding transcriptional LysR family regulator
MAERHVTRAAARSALSQPAMALNRLRHLLGDRLFERRDGRMESIPRALELAGPIHGALPDISRTLAQKGTIDPR